MAKKYIDSDAAFNAVLKLYAKVDDDGYCWVIRGDVAHAVDDVPAADVVEVRHGRWINERCEGLSSFSAECSECTKRTLSYFHYNYCPNCGAKMDGDGE